MRPIDPHSRKPSAIRATESPAPDRSPSIYAEFPPPAALRRHFLCFWVQVIGPGSAPYAHRVLPDACIDIVWIGDNVPIVVGPATSSVIVPLAPRTWVLGARLKPGHAPAVLGFPAHEALNREVRLADVWGRDAAELSQRMHAQPSLTAKRALLEAALAKRTRPMATEDGDVGAAIAWLAAHPAGRVRELSCQLGISSRQLQRRFVSAVGYGPKTFQRIARFQRALAMAGPVFAAGVNMAGLAQDAGYTDQAHMSREVRDLSGRPAASMLGCVGSTLEMSDLFNTRLDAASYP